MRVCVFLLQALGISLFFSGLSTAPAADVAVQVLDLRENPVPRVQIVIQGFGSGGLTDRYGKTFLHLPPQTQPNTWIDLMVVPSEWVLISPWNKRALLPAFEQRPDLLIKIWVCRAGDEAVLGNVKLLVSVTEKTAAAATAKDLASKTLGDEQRRRYLGTLARELGVNLADLEQAIEKLHKSKSPYEQGVLALYEKRFREAASLLKQALEQSEAQANAEPQGIVNAALFLGHAYYMQGEYRFAAVAYKKAADFATNDTGLLNHLAMSMAKVGDYENATIAFRRAYELRKTAGSEQDAEAATALTNLALLCFNQHDYEGAEKYYRQALPAYEKTLGLDNAAFATHLYNMGVVLYNKRDYEQALSFFMRHLQVLEISVGSDTPDLAEGYSEIGRLLFQAHDLTNAESLLAKALAVYETKLPSKHPRIAQSHVALAQLLQEKGDLDGAEKHYQRALDIRQEILGRSHRDLVSLLENIVNVREQKKDSSGAELAYQRIAEILQVNSRPQDDRNLAIALSNIGDIRFSSGDFVRAEPYLRKALDILLKTPAPDQQLVRVIQQRLDVIRERQKRTSADRSVR